MKFREFYKDCEFEPYAIGDSNWDLFLMKYKDHKPTLVALAKEGTGAADCHFGNVDYLKTLEKQGYNHGFTLLEEGKCYETATNPVRSM